MHREQEAFPHRSQPVPRLARRARSYLGAAFLVTLVACGQSSPELARPRVRVTIPVTTSTTTTTTTTLPPVTTTMAPPPAADPPPAPQPVESPSASGHGPHSQAWWNAIATCESGNTDAPRTGWFGLEAGEPVGGMSYADQLAWAKSIDEQSGDSAWGCSPVAWSEVPSG